MAELDNTLIQNIVESVTSELDNKRVTRQNQGQASSLDLSQLTFIISAIIKGLMPVITDTIKNAIKEEKAQQPQNNNKDILKLKIELDNANQYSRKDSCRISGLVEEENGSAESNENLIEKVVDLGNKIGADISQTDISVTHRLPIKISGVRQTIVKFTSRRAKESFYKARIKLKNMPTCKSIFIAEDLTQLRYKLLQQCKTCVGFSGLTTSNTKIIVWREGFANPFYITQPEDLTKIGLVPDYKKLGLL